MEDQVREKVRELSQEVEKLSQLQEIMESLQAKMKDDTVKSREELDNFDKTLNELLTKLSEQKERIDDGYTGIARVNKRKRKN